MRKLGFTYEISHRRAGRVLSVERVHNLMPIEGINHMFDVQFHAAAQVTTWFVGVYSGDFTPLPTTTMATLPGAATEFTGYTSLTRVEWSESAPTGGTISNAAAEALFVLTSPITLRGAFLSSSSVKGGITGVLASATKFVTPKPGEVDDEIFITIPFELISTV